MDCVYIGYDDREFDAYRVCWFSIHRRSKYIRTKPLGMFHPAYHREFMRTEQNQRVDAVDGKPFSTSFSFARFLVPIEQNYRGWAVFTDCDFLFLTDLHEIAGYQDDRYAVRVVKHNHIPREIVKMDGLVQQAYPRKNWSSFVLWNCGHRANRALSLDAVNSMPGRWLHTFGWLKDDEIGDLPPEWNHLAGYDPERDPQELKAIHYTLGGPWFTGRQNCPYGDLWLAERAEYQRRLATDKDYHAQGFLHRG